MGGEIRGAELRRPITGQRLALVAAGKEGKLFGVGGADRRQPFDRGRDRLVPLDLAELARAALADALQRFAQLCRRVLLHDARGTLAADHAAIDRVMAIALNVPDPAILQMDFDPAAAGAHITGGVFDLVGYFWRGVDDLLRFEIVPQLVEETSLRIDRDDRAGVLAAHLDVLLVWGGRDAKPAEPAAILEESAHRPAAEHSGPGKLHGSPDIATPRRADRKPPGRVVEDEAAAAARRRRAPFALSRRGRSRRHFRARFRAPARLDPAATSSRGATPRIDGAPQRAAARWRPRRQQVEQSRIAGQCIRRLSAEPACRDHPP